jgi:hydroxyacyl-ACP dehydratase HTD2-like protein with hotdog domain
MTAPQVGDSIGSSAYTPDALSLFLFGVAHWTAHRIHYDADLARAEGYPGLLVTAQLMSAWQLQLLSAWAGVAFEILSLTERNAGPAYSGDTLEVTGEVNAVEPSDGNGTRIVVALRVLKDGQPVVISEAVLRSAE